MNDRIIQIEQKIQDAILRWNMIPNGSNVIVGLSGGADSVALTHFLARYAAEKGFCITAAHVNHGLRGSESDSDERFVCSFCRDNRIPLKILHADIRSNAEKDGLGIEECGRRVRYSFFESLCKNKFDRIATAHTLSDSAETFLLNLAKGAGSRGLRGIPPVRSNIIRPLIGISREEVECYCSFYHLSYVTDSTNLSNEFERNRIRHEVIPVFRQINPNFENAISRTMRILQGDEKVLDLEAEEKLAQAKCGRGYSLSVLRGVSGPVLERAVISVLGGSAGPRLSFENVEAIKNIIYLGAGSVTVAGGIQCTISGNTLFIETKSERVSKNWSLPLDPSGTQLPDGRVLSIRRIERESLACEKKINNLLFNNLINYDTILNIKCIVRNRRAGDIFKPANRSMTKTLKKLFNESAFPVPLRNRLVMLECNGAVLWIESFGASQEACIAENTKNIAEIMIKECK